MPSLARRPLLLLLLAPALLLSGVSLGASPFFASPLDGTAVAPSAVAVGEIPPPYLSLYHRAATTCPGLSWTVLAAVGHVESGHGQNNGPSTAGALGPMQFLPSTWASYGTDGDGDGGADIWNPADAIFGAARYLCANGAGDPARLRAALWAYNHSHAYVEAVLAKAGEYGELAAVRPVTADAGALLANPNVSLTSIARADLAAGVVDPRVVTVLAALASRHTLSISVFRTGHSLFVAGTTTVSNHIFGRAVDVFRVDGELVSPGSLAARQAVLELLSLPAASGLRPTELGHPFADLVAAAGSFTNAAHLDHIHIGWD